MLKSKANHHARMNIALSVHTTLCCPFLHGAVSGGEATHFKKKVFKKTPHPNFARMNIALPIHTILCCPKFYGAVSGGEADLFKKMVFKKHPNPNGKFGFNTYKALWRRPMKC
jgi:hypothetical protein